VANRVAAQIHPGGNLLRRQAAQGMDDDLGTADKGRSQRVRARDPLNFRPLIIRHVPQPKSHGPAPKQIGVILQQRRRSTISTHLPDAPLSIRYRQRPFSVGGNPAGPFKPAVLSA
jgi:hypothetical protein